MLNSVAMQQQSKRFLCGPFQGCCLATTIGKTVYFLYNNGKQRCYATTTVKVFSLWSDHRRVSVSYLLLIMKSLVMETI
jgi:hypothetical protein